KTDDLTLNTGSFEYNNLKDRKSSFSIGGNLSGGTTETTTNTTNAQGTKTETKEKTPGSLSANYGFTDERQTDFATVGAGNIIVRDTSASPGTGGNTDLTKLNRDTTIAQYSTENIGLKGGFTVDSNLIDHILHPQITIVAEY